MPTSEEHDVKKGHRKRKAGPKAEKKKAKHETDGDKQRNPKAFSYHSVNKVAKAVRRTLDKKEKKHHVPVVDRTPVEPPPILVAIVGPPKVGKTTLLKCLIRNFTRQKLSTVDGPVTIVSGKNRRLTFVECGNDINCMIDLAKVADLVLLLVDASFGFEMEIFEFLNICQVHGFPRIMGVLTHLDHFKQNKTLRRTKKKLKHRFWTEVYQGAKLFYLSGMVNEEYQKMEIHNLGRFISVMKLRPLQWRQTHPYILADRLEDVTDPEAIRKDRKCDRNVCLYGYVRGTHLKKNTNIHIPGCGDFWIKEMGYLPDPCPLPEKEKKRSLNQKERLIYAPMSGVGGIVYDKDAVYIDLGGSHLLKHDEQEEENTRPDNEMVSSIIDAVKPLDEKIEDSHVSLFSGAAPIQLTDEGTEQRRQFPREEKVADSDGRMRRKAVFVDDTEEEEEESTSDEDESDESEDETNTEIQKSPKKLKHEEETFPYADSDDELEKSVASLSDTNNAVKKGTFRKDTDPVDSSLDSGCDRTCGDNKNKQKEKVKNTSLGKDSMGSTELVTISKTQDEGDSDDSIREASESDSTEEEEDMDSDDNEENDGMQDGENIESDAIDEMNVQSEDEQNKNGYDEEMGHLKWKDDLLKKASEAFWRRQQEAPNFRKLVYGNEAEEDSDDEKDEVGGLFKVAKKNLRESREKKILQNARDCSIFRVGNVDDWESDMNEILSKIKDCFVTGKWDASEDAETLLQQDDELYGDFEDLETGEKHERLEENKDDEGDNASDDDDQPEVKISYSEERKKKMERKRLEKKRRLKEMFDAEYDDATGGEGTYFDSLKAEMEQQAQLNREEFENMDEETRAQYEGFRPGVYVRVQIDNIPAEFVLHFDPSYPIVLGALLSAEQNVGYVQVRLKKHRWHKKILKTRDPLIISMGWRRFQSIVLYSIQDHNMRNRLLKYTPEHLHCHATFWGPVTPQGTGMLAVQTVASSTPDFRISATGVVVELDKSFTIVKKLKLTGTPSKVYKKTAFITGMFNSALEVAKFEGSSIRTVSGIRGQIKKALKQPEGAFRATFEDKILMSDIVFVRTWFQVQTPMFYNPVITLLLPPDKRNQWQGMKTVGQLRREKNIKPETRADSLYRAVERKAKPKKALVIPRSLQQRLPFKDKPKVAKEVKDKVQSERIAVMREPRERKIAELMKMMKELHAHKLRQNRVQMRLRAAQHEKERAKIETKRELKHKEIKKQIYRALGKAEKRKKGKYD